MDDLENIDRQEAAFEKVCGAVEQGLKLMSEHLARLLEGDSVNTSGLADSYISWSSPTTVLCRVMVVRFAEYFEEGALEIPGLVAVNRSSRTFSYSFKSMLENPADRDLITAASSDWLAVRDSCQLLLDYAAGRW